MINFDSKFEVLLKFLRENPERLSSRSKSLHIDSEEGINALHSFYLNARNHSPALSKPSTIPDEAVSVILQQCCNFSKERTEQIKIEHQLSMAAENLVGTLLERYIAKELEPYGWAWCAGDFIKAIDFIKFEDGSWKLVQIKNRDNTENSSSAAIRNGTTITKWFRSYSKPSSKRSSNTNWENFPEKIPNVRLSEDGFLDFIRNHLG